MQLSQITPASGTLVSLSEARQQCALIEDTHDHLLLRLIRAATDYAENYTGCRIGTQTVLLTLDTFPDRLPIYPVQAIQSIKYDDENGVEQTLASSGYYASLDGMTPRIAPDEGWPAISSTKPGPVRIQLRVGFDDLPESLRSAILIMVKEMFAHRGESMAGASLTPTMFSASRLLAPFRRYRL